jgi:hypothetical protein
LPSGVKRLALRLRIEIEVAVSRDTAETETAFGIAAKKFIALMPRHAGAESGQYYTDSTPA